jgi:effector-binding domain-containing protein
MPYDITTHELAPVPIISVRERLPQAELPGFFAHAYADLYAHLGRHGVPPRGEPFTVYHAFGPDNVDAEACLPVPTEIATTERIAYRLLPAMTVVETIHVGPYEELGQAYQALEAWMTDNGYDSAGPVRERYLTEPGRGTPPADYLTIVQIPIERAPVSVG